MIAYMLYKLLPKLTRSSLHRLFKRHYINVLPANNESSATKKKFKTYLIGYFHIDICEVRTEEGKLYLFVAIDRTSKFTYVELLEKAGKLQAANFLSNLINRYPIRFIPYLPIMEFNSLTVE